MPNTKNIINSNINYLCFKNNITTKTLNETIGEQKVVVNIKYVLKVCNYFQINLDDMVCTDLQKVNKEI